MFALDTLTNVVAGLFGSKDKLASDRFGFFSQDRGQLEAAYRGDWIARKIIDVPPFDMTREWRDWQAEQKQIEAIEATEERLGVQRKVARALRLARLYGGSALVMGAGDADPTKPMPPIGKDGLKYLHVMHRWEITPGQIDRDVMSPLFGEPSYYQVSSTGGAVKLHPTRVIRLLGAELPDWTMQGTDGWGDSVLQAVMDAVKQAGLATQGVAMLIHEAKLDVIRIPNLSQNLSAKDYASRLVDRFTLANTMKGLVNALVIDKEEEWDRKQISFAQMPEIMQQYLQIAAGAADIPATRLLGQAPAGMNATGDSDIRNYYDRISAEQKVMLTPSLRRLDEALIASALGTRPAEIYFNWAPLWQMSETEAATVAKTKAEATQIYAANDLIPPAVLAAAVRGQVVEDNTYPGIEAAYDDYDAGLLEEPEWQEPDPVVVDPNAPKIDPITGQPIVDAAPRTLYVSRKVENADEIIAWAKRQGFKTTLPADDLHVTVAFSRVAVDWMKAGENYSGDRNGTVTIERGGPRLLDQFKGNAVVLLFASNVLSWRHINLIDIGASWDFPEYQPHITITYEPGVINLAKVEPYQGRIVLGPELFAEVKEDWKAGIVEQDA